MSDGMFGLGDVITQGLQVLGTVKVAETNAKVNQSQLSWLEKQNVTNDQTIRMILIGSMFLLFIFMYKKVT